MTAATALGWFLVLVGASSLVQVVFWAQAKAISRRYRDVVTDRMEPAQRERLLRIVTWGDRILETPWARPMAVLYGGAALAAGVWLLRAT